LQSALSSAAEYLGLSNQAVDHAVAQGPSLTDRLSAYVSSFDAESVPGLKDIQRLVADYGHLDGETIEQHKEKLQPVIQAAAQHVKDAVDQHKAGDSSAMDSVRATLGPYLAQAAAAVHDVEYSDYLSSYASKAAESLSGYAGSAKNVLEDLLDDGQLNNSNTPEGQISSAKMALHELAVKVKDGDLPVEQHSKLSDYVRNLADNVPTLGSLEALASKYGHLTADELSGFKDQLAPVLTSAAERLSDAAQLGPDALHKVRAALGPYVSTAAGKLHDIDLSKVIEKTKAIGDEDVGTRTADKIVAYVAGIERKVPTLSDLKNLAGKYGHLSAQEVASFGDELKPYLTGVGQKIKEAAAIGPEAVQDVLAHAGPYVGAVAAKLHGIDLAPHYEHLKYVARDLADDGKLNNSVVDTTDASSSARQLADVAPVDRVAQVKGLAGDAAEKIQAYARSFVDATPNVAALKNLSSRFGQLTESEITKAKDQLAPFISGIAEHVKGLAGSAQGESESVASRLSDLRAAVGPFVLNNVAKLHGVDVSGTLSKSVSAGLDRLSRAIPDFDVSERVSGYVSGLKTLAAQATERAEDGALDAKQLVAAKLAGLKQLATTYGQVGPAELAKFKDSLTPYLEEAGNRLAEAKDAGPEYLEQAKEAIGPYVAAAVAKAKGIEMPDTSAIADKVASAKQTIGDLLDDGQINGSNADAKTVLEKLDEHVNSGTVDGPSVSERLTGYLSSVKDIVSDKLGDVQGSFSDKLEPLKQTASKYGHISKEELSVFEQKLAPVLSQASSHIVNAVETAKKVGANPRVAGAQAIKDIRAALGPAVARGATAKAAKLPGVDVEGILSTIADLMDDGVLNNSNKVPTAKVVSHHKKH